MASSSSTNTTTTTTSSLLQCKICEELVVASTLGAHSSLCRHLNTSSKNIKQLNRLINTYLDQPDIDSRVLVCGRAASGVSVTLASPQKLNRVVVALKTIEVPPTSFTS